MIMMFITILVVMVVIVTSNFYGGDRYASWKKMGTGQGIAWGKLINVFCWWDQHVFG